MPPVLGWARTVAFVRFKENSGFNHPEQSLSKLWWLGNQSRSRREDRPQVAWGYVLRGHCNLRAPPRTPRWLLFVTLDVVHFAVRPQMGPHAG